MGVGVWGLNAVESIAWLSSPFTTPRPLVGWRVSLTKCWTLKKKTMFIDRHAAGKGKVTGRERDGWGEAFLKECRRKEKAVD